MTNSKNKKPLVLIVDDTPKNIQLLASVLQSKDYQINAAINGKDALNRLDKVIPDLILLDIMMPEMDGFEVCQKIKSSELLKNIPIIFLTAKTETEDIVRGFNLGAADYITKPFNSAELLSRVDTHLDLKFKKEDLEKSLSEQKELLHILSHDLNNSFTSIIMLADLLEETSSSQHKPLVERIRNSAYNGSELIELVRQLRTIEDKENYIQLNLINLKRVLDESIYMLKQNFEKKEIELVIDVDDSLQVYAERTSLVNSVLNNFLTNAVKFSYPNSRVIVSAKKKDENWIQISVKDFGIGIPEDLLAKIFDVTKSTTRYGTKGEKGTGFGLPLVKKFVELYGGSIEINSEEETEESSSNGTEFIISLRSK
ncbi:MAG: hybrid sensor histidine kinase/response regulator [Leptospiraceae bacterium]|nr:hybrid sensor histidine kinase/response regulator [Leptospiraceae bacterium]MCP5493148.1 hybrid sensor histidine kinase/response regulator [Leptospiraceae bacterium]